MQRRQGRGDGLKERPGEEKVDETGKGLKVPMTVADAARKRWAGTTAEDRRVFMKWVAQMRRHPELAGPPPGLPKVSGNGADTY